MRVDLLPETRREKYLVARARWQAILDASNIAGHPWTLGSALTAAYEAKQAAWRDLCDEEAQAVTS